MLSVRARNLASTTCDFTHSRLLPTSSCILVKTHFTAAPKSRRLSALCSAIIKKKEPGSATPLWSMFKLTASRMQRSGGPPTARRNKNLLLPNPSKFLDEKDELVITRLHFYKRSMSQPNSTVKALRGYSLRYKLDIYLASSIPMIPIAKWSFA